MRVVFVAHSYPPEQLGGVASYTQSIAETLAGRGHEVSVLCVDDWLDPSLRHIPEIHEEDRLVGGIWTRRLRFNAHATARFLPLHDVWNPVVERYSQAYYQAYRPDVVHVTGWVGFSPSVMAAAKQCGLPVVLTLTDYGLICPTANLLRGEGSLCSGRKDGVECLGCTWGTSGRTYRVLAPLPISIRTLVANTGARILGLADKTNNAVSLVAAVNARNRLYTHLLRSVDVILSPSEFLRKVFIASGIVSSARIRYQAHGHDVTAATKGQYKTSSSTIRFAYIGRIVPYKGIHLLIEAFKKLPEKASATLDIYGDLTELPTYVQELQGLAGSVSTIHFQGRFPRQEIGSVLSSVDVLILPSLWYENAPVVIAEAFAARTPVVATDLGGMAEIVRHEQNGLLFQRGSIDDLARQLERFVTEPDLLVRLRSSIGQVKSVEEEAFELEVIYQNIVLHR